MNNAPRLLSSGMRAPIRVNESRNGTRIQLGIPLYFSQVVKHLGLIQGVIGVPNGVWCQRLLPVIDIN